MPAADEPAAVEAVGVAALEDAIPLSVEALVDPAAGSMLAGGVAVAFLCANDLQLIIVCKRQGPHIPRYFLRRFAIAKLHKSFKSVASRM